MTGPSWQRGAWDAYEAIGEVRAGDRTVPPGDARWDGALADQLGEACGNLGLLRLAGHAVVFVAAVAVGAAVGWRLAVAGR